MTLDEYIKSRHIKNTRVRNILAEKIGVSVRTIYRWTDGKRSIPTNRIKAIFEATDGKVVFFL